MRLRFVMLAVVAATFASAPLWAQDPEALKHFQRGKELRDSERCSDAIPEFLASLRAEESIGGLYNLGFCHEKLGNKHEALDAYTRARDLAKRKNDERVREISLARQSLLDTSPHIKLTLPNQLPDGLTIAVDGKTVPKMHYAPGETVIFTPSGGPHTVIVAAPGYEDRRLDVETERAVPVELRPAAAEKPLPKRKEFDFRWQHGTALGLVVLGTASFVYGAIEGLVYLDERSELDSAIESHPCRTPDGKGLACSADAKPEDQSSARTLVERNGQLVNEEDATRVRSILPMSLGVLAIGAGVIVYVFSPPLRKEVSPSPSGIDVRVVPRLDAWMQGLSIVGRF